MRVKFAYAVSIVTAVAMLTACGKKQEGEAGTGASAASAAALASASNHREDRSCGPVDGRHCASGQGQRKRRASGGRGNQCARS